MLVGERSRLKYSSGRKCWSLDFSSSRISSGVFLFRLPRYACQFIEMCLMVTADHGPAVSGAHNTIVCARAGKDLISSLTSGLLTIVSPQNTHVHISFFYFNDLRFMC